MLAVAWAVIALLAVTIALLATALFQIRGEIGALGSEVRGEIGALGSELRGEIAELRSELRAEIAELRAEMREGFRAQGERLDAHIERHAG